MLEIVMEGLDKLGEEISAALAAGVQETAAFARGAAKENCPAETDLLWESIRASVKEDSPIPIGKAETTVAYASLRNSALPPRDGIPPGSRLNPFCIPLCRKRGKGRLVSWRSESGQCSKIEGKAVGNGLAGTGFCNA